MKPHVKLYFRMSGFDPHDFIPCEICGQTANDIHHIQPRGMGGTKRPESFTNLMALCRKDHDFYGDKKQYKTFLKKKHVERFPHLLGWEDSTETVYEKF